ncbi:MAG: T9SS type A sorting domain-containing protein [Bacteroidetes bacterium]|nr:T9SS type A sorting domain-containing protein [Bacteroidota bacterium]MBU1798252.1 T9SS type A sorting domain-containing protein [Bacteroidota bacterium]
MKQKFSLFKILIFLSLWIVSSISAQTYTVNLSLNGASPIAENGGTIDVEASFTELASSAADADIIVNITWTGATGDVIGETDITIPSGTAEGVFIPLTITSSDDIFLEGTESVTATIAGFTYAGAGGVGIGTPTSFDITDDETISLSGGGGAILETGGAATLTATVSGGGTVSLIGGGPLTLNVVYTGTATNGTDYTNIASFDILDGAPSGTFDVTSTSDFNIELDETVIATISTLVPGVTFGTDNQTVTITDDESITLSGSTTIPETGGSATLTATIDGGGVLDLSGDAALNLNVVYSGTATNGTDYANISSFSILDAQTSGSFVIVSIADSDIEADETVIATISTATPGISFTVNNQTVTILDDDFLTAPVNGLTGVSVEPTFTWNTPNTGGANYEVKISTAGNNQVAFDAAVIATESGVAGLTYSFTEEHLSGAFPLNNNTKYYWQVIPTGGPASEIFHFTTIPIVPVTKTLPLDAAIVDMTDVTFYWFIDGSQGSMKFKIQVKESALVPTATEWLTPDFETTTFSTNKKFVLLQGKKYYWRVIVLTSGDEVINYSSVWSFTTGGGATVTPYQTWPINGATLLTNTPTLYWYLASYAPGVTFQTKYSTSSAVGSLPDTDELNTGSKYPLDANMSASGSTNLYLTLPTLSPGVVYYWQVRAFYAATGEYGPWSAVENFLTHGSGTLVQPNLSYPVGNVIQYTTTPTVYWYVLGAGAGLTYDVYYREFGVGGYLGLGTTSNLYLQLPSLEAGKQYQWYVESNNGVSTLASSVETFVITGGVSNGYPVITWPVSNPTVYTTKPTINWFIEGSQLGLTEVELRYKENSLPADWSLEPVGITVPIASLLYTFTINLNEGSTYYFAIAAKDGLGNYSAWDQDAFSVYSSVANISDPVLTTPIGGINLATKSPTLYWYVIGDLNGVQSYEVTYSTSDVFAAGATTVVPAITNPYLALAGLTPGATYYWKVRTLYTDLSYSNFSVTETFRVDPGSNAIQPIIGGPNNVLVSTTEPTISWVLPAEHSSTLKSELLISDNSDMINATTIADIANSNYEISGLEKGKLYFWRVRTKTIDNTYSEYSGLGTFKVGDNVTGVEEQVIIPEKFSVSQNYPNPFNPSTIISYSIPQTQFVTIKIYNMLGQEIKTLVSKEMSAGIYDVTWNGTNDSGVKVATGSYIYRVATGNNIVTKKMLLLK